AGRDAYENRGGQRAARLREHFNRDFWLADEGVFALALDRDRRPCRVVTSNAGQCLFGGIADRELATRTIARLLEDDVWSGWGLRTLSERAARFNPMSYHNGSGGPHAKGRGAGGGAALRRHRSRSAGAERAVRHQRSGRGPSPPRAVLRLPARWTATARTVSPGVHADLERPRL